MMLTAHSLGKQYKTGWALRPLTLELGTGLHGLLGPNGAGKSTLLRLLAGMLAPTTGDALLRGSSVRDFRRNGSRIGYLPQNMRVLPQFTARQWLMHAAALQGKSSLKERTRLTDDVLEQVNLRDEADVPARSYSFGMIKRLGVAQALLSASDLLIVDEPTAGLDPEERIRLRRVLAEAAATRVVLLSTHVLGDIGASCREVIVLGRGRLLYHGSTQGLTGFAEDRTWAWETSENEWRHMPLDGLLSARKSEEGILCRALSERSPSPFAQLVEPTMEEGYLALMSRHDSEVLL
ncbi:ATP-binding cassette domain-containing protein [Paenibacillus pasadenensis]|uniref:ATP-binding cassette domain-containing protein n=1 Tax=Paenibacillus pasadenensis TaxID=217090 RepID=UPI00203BE28D|nr:ATP-binding cassette domain-containing protein [Paenibacillus pasadenensis]MCM3749911.1 ATP-binding cassette domain-containing protein [Paenibacillus pasadenensis]